MMLLPLILLNPYTLLIAAAVIPAIVLLVYVYRKDRIEKEPKGLIIRLLVAGVATTFLAQITESIGWTILDNLALSSETLYNALLYFVVVALSEEGFKYLALHLCTWKSKHFNCSFDGLVYSVSVSLGFALWENINYVLTYGMSTALVRAVTAIPGHCCFAVFMGAFYSAAKKNQLWGNMVACRRSKRLALWVPVLLHGFYDFCASSSQESMSLLFLVFVGAMFFVSFRMVRRLSRQDSVIIPPQTDFTEY